MNTLTPWLPYIGYIGIAAYYIWSGFSTKKQEDTVKASIVRENLIEDLKLTVERQEKKLKEYEDRISLLEKKELEKDAENRIMRDILQGRDEKTKEYQTAWIESLKSIGEIKTDVKLLLQSSGRYDTYFENIKTATDIINRNYKKR